MDRVHPHFSNGTVERYIMKWSKEGKNITKFDKTFMGLGMLTIPTKHFGWESITKTMKVVSQLCDILKPRSAIEFLPLLRQF